MFSAARDAAASLRPAVFDAELPKLLPSSVPDRYDLKSLCELTATARDDAPFDELVVLHSCLELPERLDREQNDEVYVYKLSSWIAKVIVPGEEFAWDDEDLADKSSDSRKQSQNRKRLEFSVGLSCLQKISDQGLSSRAFENPDVLLALLAFTDLSDPWTTLPSFSSASTLLQTHQSYITPSFLASHVLKGYLRLLFASSKPSTITPAGRKSIAPVPPPLHTSPFDTSSKPWKHASPASLSILRYTISLADAEFITTNWPLLIPPLLTLLDSTSTPVRLHGLSTLRTFLSKVPPKMLQQTGLGDVFEDAVAPTLHFLPSITEVQDSMMLLNEAYPALMELALCRFADNDAGKGGKRDDGKAGMLGIQRVKALDRIMRDGVLSGFAHVGESHPKIVTVLITQLDSLVERMGIHAVKHLKDIIPMLSSILSNPFGTANMQLLQACAKTVQTTILNCWPRLDEPQNRIPLVQGLAMCWLALGEEEMGAKSEQKEVLKQALKTAGMLLASSVDLSGDVEALTAAEPDLAQVFQAKA